MYFHFFDFIFWLYLFEALIMSFVVFIFHSFIFLLIYIFISMSSCSLISSFIYFQFWLFCWDLCNNIYLTNSHYKIHLSTKYFFPRIITSFFFSYKNKNKNTGHSTNFVTWIEIPSKEHTIFRSSLVSETNAQIKLCDQNYWIKAGVACFCALRY